MDVVASLTHDPLPKRYIDRTCSKVVHIATKFKTTKINSGGLIKLFTKISTHENNMLYCSKESMFNQIATPQLHHIC